MFNFNVKFGKSKTKLLRVTKLILLIVLVIGVFIGVRLVSKNQENRSQAASGSSRISVATFNVGNARKSSRANANSLADLIDGFDVVGLQESHQSLSNDIAEKSGLKQVFYTDTSAGNAIISRSDLNDRVYWNITKKGDSDKFRALQKVVIDVKGVKISFYNVHIDFNSETRKKEAEDVVKQINRDSNPVILVGDFNFGSSGCSKARGIFSGYSIVYGNGGTKCTDMIIYTKNRGLKVVSSNVFSTSLSDHDLISAVIEIK